MPVEIGGFATSALYNGSHGFRVYPIFRKRVWGRSGRRPALKSGSCQFLKGKETRPPQAIGLGETMRNLLLGLSLIVLAACGQDNGSETSGPKFTAQAPEVGKEYIFGTYPLYNPIRVFEIYGPVIDYLNRNIPDSKFRLEASRNYDDFDKKLYARKFDFALPNAYQTLNSLSHGYHVIAKMGDDYKCTGVILIRRDSGIKELADLKGKKVSYPARSALAAGMMPQYFFQTHGLDVNRDIENLYVGSQELSIMNVYLGTVAAGATRPQAWEAFQKEHPDKASELEVKWETAPLINNAVVARDDMPEALARQVAHLLDSLHTIEEGKAMLARMPLSRFELADDRRYQAIENYLRELSRIVRPLDEPRDENISEYSRGNSRPPHQARLH